MSSSRAFVTVVSGLPRSGTSMMMQMLVAGGMPALADPVGVCPAGTQPGTGRPADEDNPRGYYELEAVKHTRRDPSWLLQAPGKAVKVVHLLLYDLPPGHAYRVLLMRRDLREVVASQRVMLRRRGQTGAAVTDEQLRATFAAQMRQLEGWLARRAHFAFLPVPYAEVVARPAEWAARVDAFLGGGLDTAAMAGEVVGSLYRQVATPCDPGAADLPS
jgi:hypothetical protein